MAPASLTLRSISREAAVSPRGLGLRLAGVGVVSGGTADLETKLLQLLQSIDISFPLKLILVRRRFGLFPPVVPLTLYFVLLDVEQRSFAFNDSQLSGLKS